MKAGTKKMGLSGSRWDFQVSGYHIILETFMGDR